MYKSIKIVILAIFSYLELTGQNVDDLSDDALIDWQQLHHKLDLNKASYQQVLTICKDPILSKNILDERTQNNGFIDIKELWGVKGMYRKAYQLLNHEFEIYYQPWKNFSKQALKLDYYQAVLWNNKNLKINHPLHFKNRIKLNKGPLNLAFHYEKDPGEPFNPNLNHWGGYLSFITSKKNYSQLILGDYRVHFGFGLNWMMQSDFNQSVFAPNAFNLFKKDKGFNSFDENNFLRGILYQVQFKKLGALKFFGSIKKKDYSGTIDDYSLVRRDLKDNAYIQQDYRQLYDIKSGTIYTYQNKNTEIGSFYLFNQHRWGKKLSIKGETHHKIGLFLKQYFGNLMSYSEWSYQQGSHALKLGSEYKWGKRSALYVDVVYKGPSILSFNDFSLFSFANSAEVNYYLAWQFRLKKGWKLVFNYLSKQELNAFYPRIKERWTGLIQKRVNKNWEFYIKLQRDHSTDFKSVDERYKSKEREVKWSLRWHHQILWNESNTIKFRMEFNRSFRSELREDAYLFYLDYIKQVNAVLKIKTRVQFFNAPSYQSRIYAFQQNIRYLYAMKAFYFKGFQILFNLEAKWNKKWHTGLHVSWIHYQHHQYIQSRSQSIPYPNNLGINTTLNYRF